VRGSRTLCATFKENLLEPGGFSHQVLVRRRAVEQAALHVPDEVSSGAATFLEPAACVLRGIDKSGLGDRGCALILGAGTMGLLHLLVLRAIAERVAVVVCDPLAERRNAALELGATVTCSTGADDLTAAVEATSAGLGADVVFDTVGGAEPLAVGLSVARPGGTVVLFAHAAELEPAGFELNPFFKSEQRVVATYSATVDEQHRIAELLFAGALDPTPLISHRLPLSRFAEAVELAEARRAFKVLLEPDP
jgi:L-iditol 2-dehydrogenase